MDAVSKNIWSRCLQIQWCFLVQRRRFLLLKYDQPKEGSILSGITDTHKVYFHKLGTKQSEDQLIIGGENFKRRYATAGIWMTKDF
jgi:hypothetical protein